MPPKTAAEKVAEVKAHQAELNQQLKEVEEDVKHEEAAQ